jgi:hypothetical protein
MFMNCIVLNEHMRTARITHSLKCRGDLTIISGDRLETKRDSTHRHKGFVLYHLLSVIREIVSIELVIHTYVLTHLSAVQTASVS